MLQLLARTRQVEREQAEHAEQERIHNSAYWIEKFMMAAFHHKDPELAGHHNSVTPLASVEAARWRKTLKDVQREEAEHKAVEEAEEMARAAELKARTEGVPRPRLHMCPPLAFLALAWPRLPLPFLLLPSLACVSAACWAIALSMQRAVVNNADGLLGEERGRMVVCYNRQG